MKILLVSPFPVHPVTFGGQKDVHEKLRVFKEVGCSVDLLYCGSPMSEESISLIKSFVTDVYHCNREENFLKLFSFVPYQTLSRKGLSQVVLSKKYDVVFLESEYVAMVLENKMLNYNKLILRVHNDEVKYFKNLALSVFPKLTFLYYYLESLKFKFYFKRIHKLVDDFWCVSKDEADEMKKQFNMVHHVPIITNLTDIKEPSNIGEKVLFVGALNMPNNIQGLKWYLKAVHPLIKYKCNNYRFCIVGSRKGHDLSWLDKKGMEDSSIEIYYDAESLEPFYSNSAVFVNPMLKGAGVKVKTIGAIVEGIPVVSTSTGAEGIGLTSGEEIIIQDTCVRFADEVIFLLNNPNKRNEIANKAQKFLRKEFDIPTKIRNILSI